MKLWVKTNTLVNSSGTLMSDNFWNSMVSMIRWTIFNQTQKVNRVKEIITAKEENSKSFLFITTLFSHTFSTSWHLHPFHVFYLLAWKIMCLGWFYGVFDQPKFSLHVTGSFLEKNSRNFLVHKETNLALTRKVSWKYQENLSLERKRKSPYILRWGLNMQPVLWSL